MYDYLLGGANHHAADRAAIATIRAVLPEAAVAAWANRAFHQRAAIWMAHQAITQFVDIGCGMPTTKNTHTAVQEVNPHAKVAYLDHDPAVTTHAQTLLTHHRHTSVTLADIRDPASLLTALRHDGLIELARPVGLLCTAVLHFVADADDPYGCMHRLLAALAPGSYLALSHATADQIPPLAVSAAITAYQNAAEQLHPRSKNQVQQFFKGLTIVPPYQEAAPEFCRIGVWGAENPIEAADDSGQFCWAGVAACSLAPHRSARPHALSTRDMSWFGGTVGVNGSAPPACFRATVRPAPAWRRGQGSATRGHSRQVTDPMAGRRGQTRREDTIMTEDKARKAAIRERMAETGEPYSVARHAVENGEPAAGAPHAQVQDEQYWNEQYYADGAATEGITVEEFKARHAPDLGQEPDLDQELGPDQEPDLGQASADSAQKQADLAQEHADRAQEQADEAQEQADQVQELADQAEEWATETRDPAGRALADQARQQAERAQLQADQAQDRAERAQELADEAQERADDLADVPYHRARHRGQRFLLPGMGQGAQPPWWFPGRRESRSAMPPFASPAPPRPARSARPPRPARPSRPPRAPR
jgi:hypothetical protein